MVLTNQPWDSPLAKAMQPDDWFWYSPQYQLHVEIRDHLRRIDYKTPLQDRSHRAGLPKMTVPPWATDTTQTKFAPPPSTQDEIDAHIARLNG